MEARPRRRWGSQSTHFTDWEVRPKLPRDPAFNLLKAAQAGLPCQAPAPWHYTSALCYGAGCQLPGLEPCDPDLLVSTELLPDQAQQPPHGPHVPQPLLPAPSEYRARPPPQAPAGPHPHCPPFPPQMLCKNLLPIVVEHLTSHTRPRHQVRPSQIPAPGLCALPA